jgi:hypothetical protein
LAGYLYDVLFTTSAPCHDCDPTTYDTITRHDAYLVAAFWLAVALVVLVVISLLVRRFWRRTKNELDNV